MRITPLLLMVLLAACKGDSELSGPPVGAVQRKPEAAAPAATTTSPDAPISAVAPATAGAPAAPPSAPAPSAPASIPADGKYENVMVEGVTRPMIHIMNGGDVVLVDVDGAKPRTWEEQFKRKGDLPRGYFDLHKTDVNRNNKFDDDPVDRQGRWRMDGKGGITKE
jgi:hypothetical protein